MLVSIIMMFYFLWILMLLSISNYYSQLIRYTNTASGTRKEDTNPFYRYPENHKPALYLSSDLLPSEIGVGVPGVERVRAEQLTTTQPAKKCALGGKNLPRGEG